MHGAGGKGAPAQVRRPRYIPEDGGREDVGGTGPNLGLDAAAWADKDIFERSYVPELILSGTGAGDTSIAAFLKAAMDGYGPERALSLAAAEGASCLGSYDALGAVRTLRELEAKIDAGWAKTGG